MGKIARHLRACLPALRRGLAGVLALAALPATGAPYIALVAADQPPATCSGAGPTPVFTALVDLPPTTRYRFSTAFVVPYFFDDEGEFNLIWNQDATLLVSPYAHPGPAQGAVALPLPPLASWYAGFGEVPEHTELALRVAAYDEEGRTVATSRVTWDCTSGTVLSLEHRGNAILAPSPVSVVEYYNASLAHYFMTAGPAEIADLDRGRHPGWARTGLQMRVLADAGTIAGSVCRFYLPPASGDSHFYSASDGECREVAARFPQFALETTTAFAVFPADAVAGSCASGTRPVYRAWNARTDSNHRYVTDRALRDTLVAQGYVAEGHGPDAVAFCALR